MALTQSYGMVIMAAPSFGDKVCMGFIIFGVIILFMFVFAICWVGGGGQDETTDVA